MRVIALEYHDVVARGGFEDSGFPGGAAATYKMLDEDFARHLRELDAFSIERRRLATGLSPDSCNTGSAPPLLLTFDDGGRSALHTADALERHGWRGHFLITTDRIGAPAFLDAAGVRELHARGHVIGSHSCSHPLRMSACSREDLQREWNDSVAALAEILGRPITVASVPGGGYSDLVAKAADTAGLKVLFTSEPVTRTFLVGECRVVGRFTLRRNSPAALARRFASGSAPARLGSWVAWNAKKAAKAGGGHAYLAARRWLFDRA